MAEALGLSLAVVGLAGNLKGCIDMFKYFTALRDLGRVYNILWSKLDIEKFLLLQWAERVRILEPDYDSRLDDATTLSTVSAILANIKWLLEDSNGLEINYGLKRTDMTNNNKRRLLRHSNRAMSSGSNTVTSLKMHRFEDEFERLQMRIG